VFKRIKKGVVCLAVTPPPPHLQESITEGREY
jgi:hypothetical protein